MKAIWKYPLEITDVQTIMMPVDAAVLTVQVQNDQPCIWAMVYTDSEKVQKTVRMYGTGHPIDTMGVWVGTFQVQGGRFVFHVFVE